MRLLWLAEDCRRAGLKVVEVDGWQTRGGEFPAIPDTVIVHHTGTPATARGDLPTRKILIDGRSDLPGPLCQVGLGRDGTVYVIASGKANHAGKGAWRGTTASVRTIGVEAEHPGVGPWPKPQKAAYALLCAVLLRGLGQQAERLAGHKEWALPKGRKTDPNFDMAAFRIAVSAELVRLHAQPTPAPPEGDDMPLSDADVERVAQRAAVLAEARIKEHLAVVLHGTKTGDHPANIDNLYADTQAIRKKVGA